MTVKEIKALFPEYRIGMASVSDLILTAGPQGLDMDVSGLKAIQNVRPMLVATDFRQFLVLNGLIPDDYIPSSVSGSVTVTDVMLTMIKTGSDYAPQP